MQPSKKNTTARQIRAAAFRCERIEHIPVDQLRPYPGNARTHDERQITIMVASMREFGFINPIMADADNVIIAGHGRLEAAKRLGMSSVPVSRIAGLTPDQVRAYRISDNRIAELAGWDDQILAIELQHLSSIEVDFSIEVTGWSTAQVDAKIEDEPAAREGSGGTVEVKARALRRD